MMFTLGVIVTALAILFWLSHLAFWASGRARHPVRFVVALVALFVVGLALLME
jgi:hypothetical protein